MPDCTAPIIVAGHLCLDVIPEFPPSQQPGTPVFRPGELVEVGRAILSTGGAVANTGLALHRLGVPVRLIGKTGEDPFGQEIRRQFEALSPGFSETLVTCPDELTSYSIVISPPGCDRTFFHCPGANDTFTANDVSPSHLAGGALFHFGYPPVMRQMYLNGAAELVKLLKRVKEAGLTVSLDLCMVDPRSAAGQVDWKELLSKVLPYVDLFCPSLDELTLMLHRGDAFDPHQPITIERVRELADWSLQHGAAIVALKLGEAGLYLKTSSDPSRFQAMGSAAPRSAERWFNRELHTPCFEVTAVGTTGSGDCTIAGLLAAIVRGEGPEETLRSAVAVGAASVEAADATSGVPHWSRLKQRIEAGWRQRPALLSIPQS